LEIRFYNIMVSFLVVKTVKCYKRDITLGEKKRDRNCKDNMCQ